MKRLELSRLMDEYRDDEFFPEGGSAADTQAVKDRVLAEVNAAPAKKRRVPSLKAALLAAALAVGCVLMIAAGIPSRVLNLANGETVTYLNTGNYSSLTLSGEKEEPIILEDGRLWLVINGEHTDITDLIDMDTPYVYDNTNLETGYRDYLVVGGTLEDYGWVEFYECEDNNFAAMGGGHTDSLYYTIDGMVYPEEELSSEQLARFNNYSVNNNEGLYIEKVDRPWLAAARKKLLINPKTEMYTP